MDEFAKVRRRMVKRQIAARGVRDPRVLDAMARVPRHVFVPEALAPHAYDDCPLPIGHGQTISQPYIVARMTEMLELDGSERVLEIGAGCGYQTAVLATLAREVCALELEEGLVSSARETLEEHGFGSIDLRQGDGFTRWPGGGDFDAILCACAPDAIPPVLTAQLGPGGRLVLPVGRHDGPQMLHRVRRAADDHLEVSREEAVRFVPMRRPSSRGVG